MTLALAVELVMAVTVFVFGLIVTGGGCALLIGKEYREAFQGLPRAAAELLPKAIVEDESGGASTSVPNGAPAPAPAATRAPAAGGASNPIAGGTTTPVVAPDLSIDLEASVQQLLDEVQKLVQTAVGAGVLLCMIGITMCGAGFYMAFLASTR